MWMFAVLLVLAAGMFPLQAVVGQGASEIAWQNTFLLVFGLVTSLTVILTTGKGYGLKYGLLLLLLTSALLATTGGLVVAGIKVGLLFGSQSLLGAILKWMVCATASLPLLT